VVAGLGRRKPCSGHCDQGLLSVDGIRSGVGVGTNKHGIRLICLVLLLALQYPVTAMELARAVESLKAAEPGLHEGLVTLLRASRTPLCSRPLNSLSGPQVLSILTSALAVRQAADYGETEVSAKIAQRQSRRAATFVQTIEEAISRGKPGSEAYGTCPFGQKTLP
jgi:hypothetical protein